MSAQLEAVLTGGEILVLREEAGIRESWQRIHEQTLAAVGAVAGPEAGAHVERDGLGALHEVLAAEQIGPLRDAVMPQIRAELFAATCRVAREVLGIGGEFYVDDYTILRVNFPYEVALQAPMEAENPGIGRMSERARGAARAARVVDPVYDPRGYHRDQPPAAWAHGPHLDTWTGHSRDGVNLWWAIGDVAAENSMFFYPELFGTPLAPDPRSLYLASGQPLPQPTPMPLAAGELIVFNPEVLHGTHLNVSGRTRVAASTRINARAPRFDPTCFYAREFWHSSVDLERGELEQIVRFTRAANLAAAAAVPEVRPSVATVTVGALDGTWREVAAAADLRDGGKLLLVDAAGEAQWLLCRTRHGVRAVAPRCPHIGTELADGHHDDDHIYCPAHAVRFDLAAGACRSPVLRLPTAQAREQGGRIAIRITSP